MRFRLEGKLAPHFIGLEGKLAPHFIGLVEVL